MSEHGHHLLSRSNDCEKTRAEQHFHDAECANGCRESNNPSGFHDQVVPRSDEHDHYKSSVLKYLTSLVA